MIKVEIKVRPKSIKQLEFSQTIDFITNDLTQLCNRLLITNMNGYFLLTAEVNSREQLTDILYSKEFGILSGAIRTLCQKPKIIIKGIGNTKRGSDLQEIRLNFLKNEDN